jgi:thioredoxin-like negative regulator of GroEL
MSSFILDVTHKNFKEAVLSNSHNKNLRVMKL